MESRDHSRVESPELDSNDQNDDSKSSGDLENGTSAMENEEMSKEADFNEAVAASGFGKFHVLLYLFVIPASWASSFDTSTSSIIAPSAECDLNLTLFQKGLLNGAVYAGMVSSGLLWGFISDTFGRKRIVFYGYMLDGICNILSGLSQNFYTLAFFRFLCGFIVSGPHSAVLTYCSEFVQQKHRPKVTFLIGLFVTVGGILSAVLALLIMPQNWSFSYYGFSIHPWQIYLIVVGSIILLGALCIGFFPESPKFLMAHGRNEEALEVFRQIYAVNSNKSKSSYPIKLLENETKDEESSNSGERRQKTLGTYIREGFSSLKPLFIGLFLPKLLLMVTIQFSNMLSNNTVRLWQPQLFAYLLEANTDTNSTEEMSFCSMIDQSTLAHLNRSSAISFNQTIDFPECKPVDQSIYTNTIIISTASVSFSFLVGTFMNVIQNKYLLMINFFAASCSVIALNWSENSVLTLVLISLFVGCLRACVNLLVSVVVNLFPTTMRATAVSLTMMSGRVGSLIGNIVFPVFLQYGCTIALMSLASLEILAFFLTMLIPKPGENLK